MPLEFQAQLEKLLKLIEVYKKQLKLESTKTTSDILKKHIVFSQKLNDLYQAIQKALAENNKEDNCISTVKLVYPNSLPIYLPKCLVTVLSRKKRWS